MTVKFFNSITGKKEEFQPRDPQNVKIYSCGPTVYNYNHIGNFRSYVFVDILRRTLRLLGYRLNQTMNITDIDDKIIRDAGKEKIPIEEFTKKWTAAFFEDLETLRIEKVENYPRATESIPEMLAIIKKLLSSGIAYSKDGNIYYSIEKFNNYGKLSKLNRSGMISGARYDADEYTKDNVSDFVLWKAPKEIGEKFWETDIGKGRPGWHLECSAMIRQIYSSGIDIHTGGIDLLFPHHENEIAQSEGAFPEEKFVQYWLHCEHLLVDGQKMSKSLGNYYTLRDLINRGHNWKAIRYLLLSFHYRTKLNFSLSRISEAEKAIQKMQNLIDRLLPDSDFNPATLQQQVSGYAQDGYEKFLTGLCDDLNIAKSLGTVFDFIHKANQDLESDKLNTPEKNSIIHYFHKINEVLGVLEFQDKKAGLDIASIQKLVDERLQAKSDKDFSRSDEIRKQLQEMNIILEDTKTGTTWRIKD